MNVSKADFAIISQNLLAIPREMGAKLIQSSFSTIVREARDCSAAILDAEGRVIAQVDQIPILLGSMSSTFRWSLEYLGDDPVQEDEFVITNDPYSGGQHLQDVFIFCPVYYEGRLVAYTATVAHHLDIGGGSAGISASATDVYGEGLRIPPIKLNFNRDWNGGAFERLVKANVRVPDLTLGDFDAQFAANAVGKRRFLDLIARHGVDKVEAVGVETLNYAERMMRAAIRRIPDGVYVGEDFLDDDGIGNEPVPIRVTVTVKGDEIDVDFAGTAQQVRCNLNSPYAATVSTVLCCLKAILTGADVPFNQGGSRPVSIRIPQGTVLNPRPPAAVRARLEACYRAYNAIMMALSEVLPDKVAAPGFDTLTVGSLSRLNGDKYSVYLEVFGGGNGATQSSDGCSAVDSPLSNCTNTPVETADRNYDYFRVVRYELVPDSCGHGAKRGGLGFIKEYEVLSAGVSLALYGDRFRLAPRGLAGGMSGSTGACYVTRGTDIIHVGSKGSLALEPGDRVVFRLGGGGGYGNPMHRNRQSIEADVRSGLITRPVAEAVYGCQAP
jgi:N-methylhydantoinase B